MFGMIGALIFGVVYAGAWMADEDREQTARREAKKTRNYPYYWDKNGKLRHADTGKKYGTADALREIERQKSEREERRKKEEKKYWGFIRRGIYYDKQGKGWFDWRTKPVLELFDNYEDYKKYNNEKIQYYKSEGIDIISIIDCCMGINHIKHFSDNDIENEIKCRECEVHYNFHKEE